MPQVVSANRLSDGIVVFYGPGGEWVELLDGAAVFDGKAAIEAALAAAQRDVAANHVVDIFPFDVKVSGGRISPVTLRDSIRTSGPTVHRDHGKQSVVR
jgi:hypothetical protein